VIDAALAGRAVGTGARLQSSELWPGAQRGLTHRESEPRGVPAGFVER